jgi:hypothetical protein
MKSIYLIQSKREKRPHAPPSYTDVFVHESLHVALLLHNKFACPALHLQVLGYLFERLKSQRRGSVPKSTWMCVECRCWRPVLAHLYNIPLMWHAP